MTPIVDRIADGFLDSTGDGGHRFAGGGKETGVSLKGLNVRLHASVARSETGVAGRGYILLQS
jgi:hypothetical protein